MTAYHAKYFAHKLTKRCSSDSGGKLAASFADAQVDLNPTRSTPPPCCPMACLGLAATRLTHANDRPASLHHFYRLTPFHAMDRSFRKRFRQRHTRKRLWDAADQLRANSGLKAQEYSSPVLGLIFLRFADVRFAAVRALLDAGGVSSRRASRVDDATAYHAEGVLFLSPEARFEHLLSLPEGADVGKAINDAMRDIEKHNPQLAGVLPKTYNLFTGTLLKELLKKVSEIPATVDYDAFGRIYEPSGARQTGPQASPKGERERANQYFLGEFAPHRGPERGEFYTVLHRPPPH